MLLLRMNTQPTVTTPRFAFLHSIRFGKYLIKSFFLAEKLPLSEALFINVPLQSECNVFRILCFKKGIFPLNPSFFYLFKGSKFMNTDPVFLLSNFRGEVCWLLCGFCYIARKKKIMKIDSVCTQQFSWTILAEQTVFGGPFTLPSSQFSQIPENSCSLTFCSHSAIIVKNFAEEATYGTH